MGLGPASKASGLPSSSHSAALTASAKARRKRSHAYGALGQGSTWQISLVTTLALLALWWLATRMAWVKPLFLPSPGATLNAFMSTLPGQTQGDTPLIQHIGISVMRVLAASNFLRTDIVLMGIVVIGVLAYAFDLLMRQLEKILTPWKGKV